MITPRPEYSSCSNSAALAPSPEKPSCRSHRIWKPWREVKSESGQDEGGFYAVPAMPLSYLQVVTLLHVEMQPVLQLFQVLGFLQDALPLAKSLQAACFPAAQNQSGTYKTPPLSSFCLRSHFGGGQGRWPQEPHPALAGTQILALQPLAPHPTTTTMPRTHHGCICESYRCSGGGDGL